MKRILMILLAVLLLSGCAGVQVAANNPAKVAGVALGTYVAIKYPAMAPQARFYASGLLAMAKEGKVSFDQAMEAVALLDVPGDPELVALVSALMSAVTVEIETGQVNAELVAALEGFVQGLGGTSVVALGEQTQAAHDRFVGLLDRAGVPR